MSQPKKLRCRCLLPILLVTVVFWENRLVVVVAVAAPWKVNNRGWARAG